MLREVASGHSVSRRGDRAALASARTPMPLRFQDLRRDLARALGSTAEDTGAATEVDPLRGARQGLSTEAFQMSQDAPPYSPEFRSPDG